MKTLTSSHYQELKASCISDAIISKYFRSLYGEDAQRFLIEDALGELHGHSTQYATAPVRRLQRQTEHVKAGGWICTANGQIKPDQPRQKRDSNSGELLFNDDGTPKFVKYEIVREKPYKGANVSAMWPIGIPAKAMHVGVEGSKKGASTASIGYPSIGLPGNQMGLTAKNDDGDRFLIPALQAWAEQGVALCLPLDQDENPKTRNGNELAAYSLASKYEAAGGKCFIAEWPSEFGKGIDDLQKAKGADYVHSVIAKAKPFKEWNADRLTKYLRAKNAGFYGPTCDRTIVNQRYVDYSLPEGGGNLAVSSPMETGKTVAGGRLKDEFFKRHPDGIFELIGYRNGLGQQTAHKWGIDHISDLGIEGTNLSQMLIDETPAVAYCIDSLNRRAPKILSAIAEGRKVCLFLDEIDALLKHALEGGTLGKRQTEIWSLFCQVLAAVAASGGYIIAAEASVPQLAIDAIAEISGAPVTVVENIYQPHAGRQVIDYSALNAEGKHSDQLLSKAAMAQIRKLSASGPVFVATDVQGFAERADEALKAEGLSVLRIDGTTVELDECRAFLADPNNYTAGNRPDAIIVTTTAESGISIDGGYFQNVVLYGAHLEDRALAQLSGRVRGNVPLHLFVKRRVRSYGDNADKFSVEGVLKEWQQNAQDGFIAADVAQTFDAEILKAAAEATQGAEGEQFHRLKAAYAARVNISRFSLHYGLIGILEKMGCAITRESLQPALFDDDEKNAWLDARDAVVERRTSQFVEAQLDKDVAWALRVQGSASSKQADRVKARKILLDAAYPGLPLNDEEFAREEIIKRRGDRIRAHEMAWLCKHPKIAKLIDLQSWKSQLENRFMVLPALRRESAKVRILAQSALADIAKLDNYAEDTPIVEQVANWAKGRAPVLGRMLRLQIKDSQTNIAIVNKLLRKIGYQPKAIARPGSRDERQQVWSAKAQPYQAEVWAALERKWADELASETIEIEQPQPRVTDLRKEEKAFMQINDTPQNTPINSGGGDAMTAEEAEFAALVERLDREDIEKQIAIAA